MSPEFSGFCRKLPPPPSPRNTFRSWRKTCRGFSSLGILGPRLIPRQQPQDKYTLLCILFALKHTWLTCMAGWESHLTHSPTLAPRSSPHGSPLKESGCVLNSPPSPHAYILPLPSFNRWESHQGLVTICSSCCGVSLLFSEPVPCLVKCGWRSSHTCASHLPGCCTSQSGKWRGGHHAEDTEEVQAKEGVPALREIKSAVGKQRCS